MHVNHWKTGLTNPSALDSLFFSVDGTLTMTNEDLIPLKARLQKAQKEFEAKYNPLEHETFSKLMQTFSSSFTQKGKTPKFRKKEKPSQFHNHFSEERFQAYLEDQHKLTLLQQELSQNIDISPREEVNIEKKLLDYAQKMQLNEGAFNEEEFLEMTREIQKMPTFKLPASLRGFEDISLSCESSPRDEKSDSETDSSSNLTPRTAGSPRTEFELYNLKLATLAQPRKKAQSSIDNMANIPPEKEGKKKRCIIS